MESLETEVGVSSGGAQCNARRMAGGTKEDDDRQTSSVENYSKTFCLESKQRNGAAAGKAGDVNIGWRVDGETDYE